ncbi:hypothetical protein [Nitrosophilus kaiyonis]|uniref:hypothetical protein n=1 Tax=Nitrosophilus kaiyonis TaxID=2930200 RepID=UPI0024903F7F|nr:hypothetical protein [Nitrosophilus kaiyonis]
MIEQINQLLQELDEYYKFDLFVKNFQYCLQKNIPNSKLKNVYSKTLEKYIANHPEINGQKIRNILLHWEVDESNQTFIFYDNNIISLELYKSLYFITETMKILNIIENSNLYPKKFAAFQSDFKEIKSFRLHYKKNLVGRFSLSNKKEARIKYFLSTVYYKNKELTKFFLHNLLITDIFKISLLSKETEENIDTIFNALDFFLTQRTTKKAVIKSLGILLFYQFKSIMKIPVRNSEILTQNIIYDIFEENINMYEFKRHIYIKSSINWFPIFAASKKTSLTKIEQEYIKNKLLNEIKLYGIKINENVFNKLFEIYMKNPVIQFLQKYPGELIRINPKYSS